MNVRHSKLGQLAAVAGFIATTALAIGPASASIIDAQTKSVTLKYDPRALNTVQGAEQLLSRVSGAAAKICDDSGTMVELYYSKAYQTCRRDAIARAVMDINRPTVTALYDRRFADRSADGLHAALGLRPVIEIQMVSVGWTEVPEAASTAPAL